MASTGNRSKGSKGKGKGRAAGAAAAPRSLRANEARAAQQDAPAAPLLAAGSGRDIAGVVLAIVAVASLIAVVSPSSAPVAAALAGFFHLGFGLGGYVVPLVMLAAAALLFIGGEAPVTARTAAGAALIFCAVLAMLSLSVPGTEVSTAAMFDEARLSSSGGYLGAFAASALQGALGKTISYVVLVGAVVLGLVIIGFSVGDLARGIAERAERFAGESKYPLKKMIAFAADGITSFSVKPIRLVFSTGVVVFIVSLIMLIYALVAKLAGHTSVGWTSLMGSIWLIGGIQLLGLGVVGEYIGKIYNETKRRPRFIIESVLNKADNE